MNARFPARPTVTTQGDTLVIRIPMDLKRRGGRKEIIVPEGLPGSETGKEPAQEPLVTAVARAFYWQELVEDGKYGSITELARALDLDRRYVARTMDLTLLSPRLVEAIVDGDEPSGLSLEGLRKGFPLEWQEQEKALGLRSA